MTEFKILLIDDDAVDIKAHKRLLNHNRELQFDTDEVDSVQLAITKLKEKHFDCVLLDYNMPGYTGLDLLDKINAINPDHNIPIILLTGKGDEKIAINAFKRGIHDYLIKNEITADKLTNTIVKVIDEQKIKNHAIQEEIEIRELAYRDHLTRILNRRGFHSYAIKSISYCERHNVKSALFYVDIDDFKKINDKLGHAIGDQLIIQMADSLSSVIRSEDIVARLGGDEFIIFLFNIVDDNCIHNIAQKILGSIKQCDFVKHNDFNLTCSIGITTYDHDISLTANIDNADKSLYISKKSGKNKYHIFDKDLNK